MWGSRAPLRTHPRRRGESTRPPRVCLVSAHTLRKAPRQSSNKGNGIDDDANSTITGNTGNGIDVLCPSNVFNNAVTNNGGTNLNQDITGGACTTSNSLAP